jgi:hypothetical protein
MEFKLRSTLSPLGLYGSDPLKVYVKQQNHAIVFFLSLENFKYLLEKVI